MTISRTSVRHVVVLIALMGSAPGCSDDPVENGAATSQPPTTSNVSFASSTTSSPATSTAATSADVTFTAVDDESFFCGEFGSEDIPSLIGLDIASGERVWERCGGSTVPISILGRSVGAALLLQQAGGPGEMFAVDDNGVEQWRRPSSPELIPRFVIGESTIVIVDDAVEAIDVGTGDDRWQHPPSEGIPVAAKMGLIVEVVGGPYAPPDTPANPADAGKAILRALDALTGEMRWSRDVQLVPLPTGNQYSLTAGNTVLAVPTSLGGGTAIIDIATGTDLRQEPGDVWAIGDLLIEIDPNLFSVVAVSDALTGTKFASVPVGSPVIMNFDAEHPLTGSGLLLYVSEPNSSVQSYHLVDVATGDNRWVVENGSINGLTNDHAVVALGPSLRLLDNATGSVLWEHSAPAPNVNLAGVAFGNDVVIVAPQFAGD